MELEPLGIQRTLLVMQIYNTHTRTRTREPDVCRACAQENNSMQLQVSVIDVCACLRVRACVLRNESSRCLKKIVNH